MKLEIPTASKEPATEQKLIEIVKALSEEIGERNYLNYRNLSRAAEFIDRSFKEFGYKTEKQSYNAENQVFENIIASKIGSSLSDKVIIIGAHYDSAFGSPGADDNASAVAILLILAEEIVKENTQKTVKFIAFANEEPPFFQTDLMGSFIYAKQARQEKEDIEIMICLESLGYYSDEKNSQNYPPLLNFFYPDKGNFVSLLGDLRSAKYVKRTGKIFKAYSSVPIETLIGFSLIAPAIRFSDHDSFWRNGFKAVMLTDTAFYRTPYYHTSLDTADKLNYEKMSDVVAGIKQVILNLSNN